MSWSDPWLSMLRVRLVAFIAAWLSGPSQETTASSRVYWVSGAIAAACLAGFVATLALTRYQRATRGASLAAPVGTQPAAGPYAGFASRLWLLALIVATLLACSALITGIRWLFADAAELRQRVLAEHLARAAGEQVAAAERPVDLG